MLPPAIGTLVLDTCQRCFLPMCLWVPSTKKGGYTFVQSPKSPRRELVGEVSTRDTRPHPLLYLRFQPEHPEIDLHPFRECFVFFQSVDCRKRKSDLRAHIFFAKEPHHDTPLGEGIAIPVGD